MNATTRRPGRPINSTVPGQRKKLGLIVRPQIGEWLERKAKENASTLSQEGERQLEIAHNLEGRLGGPRVLPLLQLLPEVAERIYGEGDGWCDDRQTYLVVAESWYDTLIGLAPPSADPVDIMIDVGHRLMAALPAAEGELEQYLRQQLRQLAEMPGLSNRERDIFSLTADSPDNQLSSLLPQPDVESLEAPPRSPPARETAADPGPEPISLEEKIESGCGLIAALRTTTDPRRRDHLRELLSAMAQLEGLPDDIRGEFARAARADLPEAGVSGTPSVSAVTLPPRPPRPTGATRFLHDAWVVARQLAFNCLQHEPDDREIAEALVTDRGLILFAELYLPKAKVALTVDGILAYRARLLTEPAASTVEASDAAPAPPRTTRRRRSAPAARLP